MSLDALASRSLNQSTRRCVPGRPLDTYLEGAAKELSESRAGRGRASAGLPSRIQLERTEELSKQRAHRVRSRASRRADRRAWAVALGDRLQDHMGLPSLAGLLGPKSEARCRSGGAGTPEASWFHAHRQDAAYATGALASEFVRRRSRLASLYMMKLSHLVDDKIHARSIGPYSLGDPAAPGGQGPVRRAAVSVRWKCGRSKRMERPTSLQEMLTVKSDDVNGTEPGVRGHREGRKTFRSPECPRVVQRPGQGAPGVGASSVSLGGEESEPLF